MEDEITSPGDFSHEYNHLTRFCPRRAGRLLLPPALSTLPEQRRERRRLAAAAAGCGVAVAAAVGLRLSQLYGE